MSEQSGDQLPMGLDYGLHHVAQHNEGLEPEILQGNAASEIPTEEANLTGAEIVMPWVSHDWVV